jgi:iron complex outermembrane receptor protein
VEFQLELSRSSQLAGQEAEKVASKWIFSSKVSYRLTDGARVFLNARNLLNNDSREYAHTDKIGGLYLAGIELSL